MNEPIHILSLGAGVQSSTLALMAAAGEITPMPACAVFADTQAEPASVYKWLDWLEKQLPFPVHRVTKGNLAARELLTFKSKKSGKVYRKSGIPAFIDGYGLLTRKCTSDFKIVPIIKKVRELGAVPRGCKEIRVIQWIGISREEAHRMKPARDKWIQHIWPLVERGITRQKCLEWMAANKFPVPPRSACVFCPYHNDVEWMRLRDREPEEFKKAIEFEKALQAAARLDTVAKGLPFLHRSCVPIDRVIFAKDDEFQLSMFGNECEGMCGV